MLTKLECFISGVAFMLAGCAAPLQELSPDLRADQPRLHLNEFFSGQLQATGSMSDMPGNVVRPFEADMVGQWQANVGIIHQVISFNDGQQTIRCWKLVKDGDRYSGTAQDVVGLAHGKTQGNSLYWRYVVQLPVEGKMWEITLNDWMYQIDESNLVNNANISKFGMKVGEVSLHITRHSEAPHRDPGDECQIPLQALQLPGRSYIM